MERPLCLLYEFLVAIAIDEIGKDRHLSGKVGQGRTLIATVVLKAAKAGLVTGFNDLSLYWRVSASKPNGSDGCQPLQQTGI